MYADWKLAFCMDLTSFEICRKKTSYPGHYIKQCKLFQLENRSSSHRLGTCTPLYCKSRCLGSIIYSLKVVNHSRQEWIFYVYQTDIFNEGFPLTWLVSLLQIPVNNVINFYWATDYQFLMSDIGKLIPGVIVHVIKIENAIRVEKTIRNLQYFQLNHLLDNYPNLSRHLLKAHFTSKMVQLSLMKNLLWGLAWVAMEQLSSKQKQIRRTNLYHQYHHQPTGWPLPKNEGWNCPWYPNCHKGSKVGVSS